MVLGEPRRLYGNPNVVVAILLPFWHWFLPCIRRLLAVLGIKREANTAFNLCKLAKHYAAAAAAATAAGFIFSGI